MKLVDNTNLVNDHGVYNVPSRVTVLSVMNWG